MTSKQLEAMVVIDRFTRDRAISPNYQELCDALGLKSKSGVHRVIKALREQQLATFLPKRAGTIRLTPKGEQILRSTPLANVPTAALIAEAARRGLALTEQVRP